MALLAGAIVLLQPISVNGSADRGYRHARLQRSQAARCPVRLASAGSGDVLAGIIAALRARGLEPFAAASAGVWLHGRAAEIAGPHMIADDLADAVPKALALLE